MRTVSWPSTPGIIFGGDYNPEQWDRSVWDEDVKLMRQAGVNVVSIGIFSWSVLQPTEDTWDFTWLDDVFELLHANGIGIDLGTGTASPPPWLSIKHPEILLVNELGDTVWPGGRQHWRPTSSVYRKYARVLVERLAHRYGSHPALVAWHVNNELGCQNHFDFSDDAINAFRVFLDRKYSGRIGDLNAAWETAFWSQRYSNFDEIFPPRALARGTFHNPSQMLDWRRFSSEALLEYYVFERNILRAITPRIPVTTNLVVMGKQTKDRNYATWVNELDFISNDHYIFQSEEQGRDELSFSASLTSALASRQPWFLMEHSTSAVQWQRVNTPKASNELLRDSLTHLAHGADAICFFQWRQSKAGAEMYHSSMIPHAGPDSRLFRDVRELGRVLAELGDIKGSEKERGQVAILFDWESWWVAEGRAQPSQIVEYKQEVLDWFVACLDAGIRADIIPTSSIAEIAQYPMTVGPMLHVVTDKLASAINRYVEEGGHFVTTYWSGITDEKVHMRLGGYPGAFRDLLGIRVEELAPIANTVTLSEGATGEIWSDPMDITGDNVEVMRSYVDGLFPGKPAVTRRIVNTGSAAYVSTKLKPKSLKGVLSDLLKKADIKSDLEPAAKGKVEQVFRVNGQTRWEFLINRTDEEVHVGSLAPKSVLSIGGAGAGVIAPRGVGIFRHSS